MRSPAGRPRRRLATVLLPLLALLAGAGIAAALFQALSDGPPTSTASAAEQQRASGRIVLDAADYIGRPVDEVAERLTSFGLNVELREEVTEDTAPDRVTAIEPSDTSLAPGDTVVVTYAVAPAAESVASDPGGSPAAGQAVADDPTPTPTSAAPTETPAAVSVSVSAVPETPQSSTTLPATTSESAPTSASTSSATTTTSAAPSSSAETSTPVTSSASQSG